MYKTTATILAVLCVTAFASAKKFITTIDLTKEEEGFAVVCQIDDSYDSLYLGKTPLSQTVTLTYGVLVPKPKKLKLFYYKPGFQPQLVESEFKRNETVSFTCKKIPREQKIVFRSEFSRLANGRTLEEMIEIFGRPDSTSNTGGDLYLYYRDFVADNISLKIDPLTQVIMKNRRVTSINY